MENEELNFTKRYTLQDMQDVVKGAVIEVLRLPDDEKPTVSTRLDDDLLADSIDAVDIVMELEEKLMISIADREAALVHHMTIGEIAELCHRTYYGGDRPELK